MQFTKNKKVAAALGAGAIAVATTGVAYAYWTTTGTGTGTAAVGTSAATVTVVGTADSTALTPGGPSSTVSFTADNPENFNQSISKISLTAVAAYDTAAHRDTGGATGLIDGCGTADFSMPDVDVDPATDGDLAGGADDEPLTAAGDLSMIDRSVDQEDCKGAFLALTFATS